MDGAFQEENESPRDFTGALLHPSRGSEEQLEALADGTDPKVTRKHGPGGEAMTENIKDDFASRKFIS